MRLTSVQSFYTFLFQFIIPISIGIFFDWKIGIIWFFCGWILNFLIGLLISSIYIYFLKNYVDKVSDEDFDFKKLNSPLFAILSWLKSPLIALLLYYLLL